MDFLQLLLSIQICIGVAIKRRKNKKKLPFKFIFLLYFDNFYNKKYYICIVKT